MGMGVVPAPSIDGPAIRNAYRPISANRFAEKPPIFNFGGAPKERRRRHSEKQVSKRAFWRVRFFSAHLKVGFRYLKTKP